MGRNLYHDFAAHTETCVANDRNGAPNGVPPDGAAPNGVPPDGAASGGAASGGAAPVGAAPDGAAAGGAPHDGAAPFRASIEHFEASVRRYFDDIAKAPAAAAEAARAFGNSLRDQTATWFQPPWSANPAGIAAPLSGALPATPALGVGREHQQRWERTAEAARGTALAQYRLQALWTDALRDAASAYAAQIAESAPAATDPASMRRLYDLWIDCAEEAYGSTARSAAFCAALADYVNAGSQWRVHVAAAVEHWSKQWDLPTRSELNSLELRLKEVEGQLRILRESAPPHPAAAERLQSMRAPRARRAKRVPKP
jgi:hypothetical protein